MIRFGAVSWIVSLLLFPLCAIAADQKAAQSAAIDRASDGSVSPNIVRTKQGFSMRLRMDNRGVSGRQSYQGPLSPDSLGLEYPIGSRIEHVFGAGLWIGGKLDTSSSGTSTPIKLTTTCYEGWSGPLYEMYPGPSPADTFWRASRHSSGPPEGWNQYWGDELPFDPISDDDFYCAYTDTGQAVSQHVPMKLKVIQSTYVWNDPYAEAVLIVEYRISNRGARAIDSAYVGFFVEADIGPVGSPTYWQRNYSAYYRNLHTAYAHNPVDAGSTPVGVRLLGAPRPIDSLRLTFRWYPGPLSPSNDVARYNLLSSGVIMPDEYPANSDTRFLLGLGPFTIRPISGTNPDTLVIAIAWLSGMDTLHLKQNAARALEIYRNRGLPTSVPQSDGTIPESFTLYQNYPNPFNPKTVIEFRVASLEFVELSVYDVLGRKVAALVNEEMKPGSYEATWDASGMASGVYFYRLTAGTFTETKRMILLR